MAVLGKATFLGITLAFLAVATFLRRGPLWFACLFLYAHYQ